jgi:hypothetical protein
MGFKKVSRKALGKRVDSVGSRGIAYIKSDFPVYRIQDENCLRPLPPHEDSQVMEDFLYEIWVHRYAGIDKKDYLCRKKMKNKKCAGCEKARELSREDPDIAKKLVASRMHIMFALDMGKKPQSEKPMLVVLPGTLGDEILRRCRDKETGGLLVLSDPEDGRKIMFDREGKGKQTRYVNVTAGTRPVPISEKVSNKIVPIEDILKFVKNDILEEVFSEITIEDLEENDRDSDKKKKSSEAKKKHRITDEDDYKNDDDDDFDDNDD